MTNRLIKELDLYAPGALSDDYLAMAYNIEESLLAAGAQPGKDYSILDLYKLSQPFALQLFKQQEKEKRDYTKPGKSTV